MTATHDDDAEVETQIFEMFATYTKAFAENDIATKSGSFITPYYDLRTTSGTPAQRIIDADDADRYFVESRAALMAVDWDRNTQVSAMKVWRLGVDLALLRVDLARYNTSGQPIVPHVAGLDVQVQAHHRVLYTVLRQDGVWKFTGYTALDAGFEGPA